MRHSRPPGAISVSGSTRAYGTIAGPAPSMSPNCPAGCSLITVVHAGSACLCRASRRFPSIRPPFGSRLLNSTALPANTTTRTACSLLPSSARATSSTRKTSTVRSPSWPPNRCPLSSTPTAAASPACSSSATPRGVSVALVFHDDRHEERWEKRVNAPLR